MKFGTLFVFFLAFATLSAQDFTQAGQNDPAAKTILDKVRAKYEAFTSMEAGFTLSIEIPEEPKEDQSGKLVQQGDKYRLDLASQTIICDGKTAWLYLKTNKEVQINSVEDVAEEGFLSPQDLLRIYEANDYVYALVNEYAEGGRTYAQIEFKPLDKNSEYSKLRVTIDKTNYQVKQIKAFAKDGSRYTLQVTSFKTNGVYPATTFVWNKSECPDCYVEDLRID